MMQCNALCLKAGKVFFALPFLAFGIFHLMNAQAMAGMVLAGWPAATFLVYISGICLILAAIALLTGKHVHLAMKLLALELAIFILTIHVPGVMAGGEYAQTALMSLLKDMGLMGGALVLASTLGSCGKDGHAGCEGCSGCGEKEKKGDCCAMDHGNEQGHK